MALISDIYSDSDEDDDLTMDHNNKNEEAEESKQTEKLTKALPQPSPRKKLSWQKKRSFTSYTSQCSNDHRGGNVSTDPNSENYVSPQMPTKKRRELHRGFIPEPNLSLFNKGVYNPVISKKTPSPKKKQTPNKPQHVNKAKNPFVNNDWNENKNPRNWNSHDNYNHHKNNGSALRFAPRRIKNNIANASTEDLGNIWSKTYSKQFTNN
eukprot:UN03575